MKELIQGLREKEEIEKLCNTYGLNLSMLKQLFINRSMGYTNTTTARKIGVHRITIQRYNKAFKEMGAENFLRLWNYILRDNQK